MTVLALQKSVTRHETIERRWAAPAEEVRRASNYPLSRWYLRPLAGVVARWLAPTRVRPWHLTLLGLAAAMAAAAALIWSPAQGWLAAGLVLTAWFFDRADGQLARCQRTASRWGAWLDANVDELGDLGLHVAVAWAAAAQTHGQLPWICLMAFLLGKYQLMHGLATEATLWPVAPSLWPVSDRATPRFGWARSLYHLPGNADVRVHLLAVAVLTGWLTAELALAAVYYNLRWVVRYALVERRWKGVP